MKRSYAIKTLGVWPVGMWMRADVSPPLWLDREMQRHFVGRAPSIYTAMPAEPARRNPLPNGFAPRLDTRGEAPF